MIGLPNPYVLIAGGVGVLAVAGSLYYQSLQIHHFHLLYNTDETKIAVLNHTVDEMTFSQNTQTAKSEQNVIRVVQIPEKVQPIINEIRTAPSSGECVPPKYSGDVLNAF